MKMHENERLEAYQVKKILKKLEQTLRKKFVVSERGLGGEEIVLLRERSREIRIGSHRKNIWNLSKARQLKVSKGVKTSVEEDVEKDNLDRLSYRVGVEGHINKG